MQKEITRASAATLSALFLVLILSVAACRPSAADGTPTGTAPARTAVSPVPPSATARPRPSPTRTPIPTATLVLPTLAPKLQVEEGEFILHWHPDGGLYAGDLVSFEIIAPQGADLSEHEASIAIGSGPVLGTADFSGFGIANRQQATLQWVWDTSGLEAGEYTVAVEILPDGQKFSRTISLLPESLRGFPEPSATWAMSESECCLFYYVTGTAAERDLEMLMETADLEASLAINQIGVEFEEAITVVFLPRVLGHGGFAGGEIYISYLDRNYAGNAPDQVLHHEMVHILDGRAGGELRPTIFVEGLAVLLSGGHFKKEPVIPRASALLDLEAYLPLAGLVDDFYRSQHEISYLQGAALIQFMIDTWGWDVFESFYRSIQPHESNQQSAAINQALEDQFGVSLAELEADFLSYLAEQGSSPEDRIDVELTVRFYDTVRRYQQALDSSAYFLTAWLIGIDEMIEREVVADYLRHPEAPENLALEILLVSADKDLRAGSYGGAARSLAAVNAVLDAIEAGEEGVFYADPLAADIFALVLTVLEAGLEPHAIHMDGDQATVMATGDASGLIRFEVVRSEKTWEQAD